jgi:hypothetical protein
MQGRGTAPSSWTQALEMKDWSQTGHAGGYRDEATVVEEEVPESLQPRYFGSWYTLDRAHATEARPSLSFKTFTNVCQRKPRLFINFSII